MAGRLTSAMEEAYASAPSNVVILHTLELKHASFGTIRVLTGDEGIASGEAVALTLENGATVDFTAMAIEGVMPGFDGDGPTSGKVRIDGVSGLLFPLIEAAAMAKGAIEVTYRNYRSDARFEPGEIIAGLKMRQISVSATSIEGTIGFDEVGTQAFPLATFNIEDYPGLFQG